MILLNRSPAVWEHGGTWTNDHAGTLIVSKNKPSRADPQDICSSNRFARPVGNAFVVTSSAFELEDPHDDARDDRIGFAPPAFALSKIIRLPRIFHPQLEVEHRQSASCEDWFFKLKHISEQGRRFVAGFDDVAAAFDVACTFRDQGVCVVCVERVRVRP